MIEISESEVVTGFPTGAPSESALGNMGDGLCNAVASEASAPPCDLVCPSSHTTASETIASNPPHIGDAASESSPGALCDGAPVPSEFEISDLRSQSGEGSGLRGSLALPVFPAGTRKQDIEEAHERARLCREWLRLTGKDQGGAAAPPYLSGNAAAVQLGRAASWFSAMVPLFVRGGVAALLPRRRDCGTDESADAKLVSEGDIARIRAIFLRTNRGRNKGSRNYAIRAYCKAKDCSAAFREMVWRRWRARRLLLPPSVIKKIWISESTVCQFRNPTMASLDYLSAPGSAMWFTDPADGQRRFIKPGQVIEADDATINFAVCVPWEMGGCPCSDKFGVKVARFQWLVAMDVGSRFVPAWTYVCRSKSSYRKEDCVTLMNSVYRQYGEPKFWRFERNIWESNAVKKRVAMAGSQLWTVYSPHQKPFIEGLFNKCWTIMSLEDGQVGRFRGEMEKENDYLVAAQRGQNDPRGTFPYLASAISAFSTALGEHHEGIIRSKEYGEWNPTERWDARQMEKPIVDLDWLAAPLVKRWMVRGNTVGGQVRLFDGYSAPFTFAAEWLQEFHGARLDCHFDPTQARCSAVATLAEDFAGRAAGELLGTVHLVNECASYARLVLEWGDDDRGLGRKIRAQSATAMRRDVRIIGADGKQAASSSEIRDGLGSSAKVETGPSFAKASEGKTYVLDPSKMFVPKSSSRQKAQESQEDLPKRPQRRSRSDLFLEEQAVNP